MPNGRQEGKQRHREGGGRREGERQERLLLVMCTALKSPQGCGAAAFSSLWLFKAADFTCRHLRMTADFLRFFSKTPSKNVAAHKKRELTEIILHLAWMCQSFNWFTYWETANQYVKLHVSTADRKSERLWFLLQQALKSVFYTHSIGLCNQKGSDFIRWIHILWL